MFSYLFKKLVNQPLQAFYRKQHFYVYFRKSIWSKTESFLGRIDLLLLAATPTAVLVYFGLDVLAGIVGTATVLGIYILNGFAKASIGLWR